jgi:hypothetical protein
MTSISQFGASDDHGQEVFWRNRAVEASETSVVAKATEFNEAAEVSKAWTKDNLCKYQESKSD